jgi:hypothetical protein
VVEQLRLKILFPGFAGKKIMNPGGAAFFAAGTNAKRLRAGMAAGLHNFIGIALR